MPSARGRALSVNSTFGTDSRCLAGLGGAGEQVSSRLAGASAFSHLGNWTFDGQNSGMGNGSDVTSGATRTGSAVVAARCAGGRPPGRKPLPRPSLHQSPCLWPAVRVAAHPLRPFPSSDAPSPFSPGRRGPRFFCNFVAKLCRFRIVGNPRTGTAAGEEKPPGRPSPWPEHARSGKTNPHRRCGG